MQICRYWEPAKGPRMGLVIGDEVADLTGVDPQGCQDISTWLSLPDPIAHLHNVADVARRTRTRVWLRELDRKPQTSVRHLTAPIDIQEIWAAGVTYERKKDSIIEEARVGGDFYDDVFDSARPQMFFKSTPHRTVGPNDSIYIRHDSQWTVPEPELALLVSPALEVVGYTCGNDVSARDIEGENPLYIQQAKTYLGSCALGPVIAVPETAGEIPPVEISMVVIRDGMTLFQGETSTAEMTRGFAELVDYLADANSFPGGAFLLTGCGVVPPAEFALEIDDVVEITMSGVGTLRTTVDQHRELPDGPEDREG